MLLLKSFIAFLFISFFSFYNAQNGSIRGTIFEDATGEPIPGVQVLVVGTNSGAVTDFEGKFSISLAEGKYNLQLSFMTYETIVISDLDVKINDVVVLDNLRMKEATNEMSEVVVTAEIAKNNENALLTMKMKSANLIDGISASNFKKIGDSDAASAMKRVSGVSVNGGKYVYVRGLGDRYNKTTLNGVDIPGLDPDRNALQMDIFPTNVIDNIIVNKSFIAELPADFTGGVIDINIKDFPDTKKGNISLSTSYNPYFHLRSDYLTYQGGKTDFLGFDDGTRAIPAVSNVPFFAEVVGNQEGEKAIRYKEILSQFNPTLAAYQAQSFLDYSLGTSFGNQLKKEEKTLGYNFVLSYKNTTEFYQEAIYGRYGLDADPNIFEIETREYQQGNFGVSNVLLTGLAGFAIKTNSSKIGIDVLHLQNGESKAGIFNYDNSDQGAVFSGFQHNLEYSQRSMTNVLLSGKHNFTASKWNIDWKVSPTLSKVEDPDIRFTRYELRNDLFIISSEAGFPERIWRNIQEVNGVGLVNFTKEFEAFGEKSKLKFGSLYSYKERDFIIRTFAFNIRNLSLTGDPNELFQPENLWPVNNNVLTGTTYDPNFLPRNPNAFNSNISNAAGYVSTELTPVKKLKTILGVRSEYYTQRYTGEDQLGINVFKNDVVLQELGIFPSANLVYSLNEKQNLRLSYGKTVARPSFKELSYAEISDPITGRTFIGGLFSDYEIKTKTIVNTDGSTSSLLDTTVYWDGKLISTNIHNFDLRWEAFQGFGQTISISAFYKKFIRPIEIVQFATQAGAFQPRNVGDGEVMGLELEIRQNLEFLASKLKAFDVTLNVTSTQSRIKLSQTEYESRVANARTGQTIDEYRAMAGQAPYLINAGFAYNGGDKGFLQGFEAGIYYNVQGKTLEYVGIVDRPDIYAVPFHSVNFNANKSFGKDNRMQLGLKVDNILNDVKESVFVSFNATDQYFTSLRQGRTFQVRYSYNF
ncbi:MAG: TonB-dependent receptor domain-containing protein [Bacteroidia bacterium]